MHTEDIKLLTAFSNALTQESRGEITPVTRSVRGKLAEAIKAVIKAMKDGTPPDPQHVNEIEGWLVSKTFLECKLKDLLAEASASEK